MLGADFPSEEPLPQEARAPAPFHAAKPSFTFSSSHSEFARLNDEDDDNDDNDSDNINDDDSEHGETLLARVRLQDQERRCCLCFRVRLGTPKKRLRSVRQELIDVFVFRQVPICPESKFSSRWLGLLLFCVMYTVLYVPFSAAWPASIPLLPWLVFDMLVDLVFILDVLLNFITSRINQEDDEWEVDFTKCAKSYLRGWFVVDLVASFPYDVVLLGVQYAMCGQYTCQDDQGNAQYQNALQILKLLRLLRVTKLVKFIASRSLSVASSVLVLMMTFVLLAHLFGCLWWLVAELEHLPEVNWVALQTSIADLALQPVQVQYSTCIYWAVVTTATLGFGDVTAKTYGEEIYSILVILTGAMFYTVIVGLVQQLVAWKFSTGAEYNQWMDRVTAFCAQNRLSKDMSSKIMGYYRYVWERRRTFDRDSGNGDGGSFMNDLPFELKLDVADNLHAKLFRANPVFQHSQTNFKHFLATKLGPGQIKLPDEVLFFEGEQAESLVLVRDGVLELVVSIGTEHNAFGNVLVNEHDELVVSSRREGQYCGDLGMFSTAQQVNFVSCVVAQFSDIHVISCADFLSVLDSFPEERALFERVAQRRTERITQLVASFRKHMSAYRNPHGVATAATTVQLLGLSAAQTKAIPATVLQSKLEQAMWQLWEREVKPEQDDKLCEEEIAVYREHYQVHRRESSTEDGAATAAAILTSPREASTASSSQQTSVRAPPPVAASALEPVLQALAEQIAELEHRVRADRG